ncbi:hypothetical protein B0A48_05524 [Cryoendolithus antarcticus]|uniref:mRNA cap guanine-N(7) methyltransferase n=1 Tax=Cryoendolithus antarcticus TaxID=1507870 RepID=A0A1V8TJ46_9PEZI|nr:hypothetical protein B0A48_05524 [Cryoendolithus antarcticus]
MADSTTPNSTTDTTDNRKRKRETPAIRAAANKRQNNAFSRRSPPREARTSQLDGDGDRSPPRKLKRPAARATVPKEVLERQERERQERERADELARKERTGAEAVATFYNSVPERGREWRSTESQIKGLRSLNNWIKSTLIQKFSRPDIPVEHLAVLDMACGKGGDLGKWEKAPQVPGLYVGCDIADVSIEQARSRYAENMRRGGRNRRGPAMRADFYVQDTFGRSLEGIPIVRQVGFNPGAGPGAGIIQGRPVSGGFDVVSMMFALHYSYETEVLAKGMLANVSGALKKGGRFIGVMPDSHVIAGKVVELTAKHRGVKVKTPNGKAESTPVDVNDKPDDEDEDDWDPEKPAEPVIAPPAETNGDTNDDDDDDDDWDPEKPSEPLPTNGTTATEAPNAENLASTTPTLANPPPPTAAATPLPDLTWGNTLYTVRLPSSQPHNLPIPHDGIFRPPYGWKYHYHLAEAVDAPEFVVPFEAFRALAEDYGLELLYRKNFREVYDDESGGDGELGKLAERMGVKGRDGKSLVGEEEWEAAGFYCAFCFYKT